MFRKFPPFFTGVENREEHILKICYSAAYFAFTFILLSYTSHAWSASNAWSVGYKPVFSYAGMENLQGTIGWTVGKIAWVYLAPPLWGLLISVCSLIAFRFIEGTQTHLKTLVFWCSLNGYLLYFSYLVTGILSGQDFSSKLFSGFVGYYSWLEWGNAKIYGILILQIILSLPYAALLSKGVLQLNYSRLLATRKNGKSVMFINIVIVPFTMGSILVLLSTFPMDFGYQIIRIFCFLPIFIITFLGLRFHKAKHISIVKGGLRPVPIWGVFILFTLLLISRFGLGISVEPFW